MLAINLMAVRSPWLLRPIRPANASNSRQSPAMEKLWTVKVHGIPIVLILARTAYPAYRAEQKLNGTVKAIIQAAEPAVQHSFKFEIFSLLE